MTSERKFIAENVKRVLLKEFLKRKTERSGFGGLDIQRTPMGTRVTLIAERPGMVIGRKGETIKELTDYVQNKFKFDNPQIEVKEVTNPNLNPHIMAQKLASALERGWHFRRAGHSTVRRIMSAGAKGCQVIISGKLTGQRHRTEKFREGHIKYCGETKLTWMHEGYAVAKKKLGVIGVKVQIMDPNAKLPDEISYRELQEVADIKTEAEGDIEAAAEVEVEVAKKTKTEIDTPEKTTGDAEKDVGEVKDKDVKKDDTETKKGGKEKKEKKKASEKKPKKVEAEIEVESETPPTETSKVSESGPKDKDTETENEPAPVTNEETKPPTKVEAEVEPEQKTEPITTTTTDDTEKDDPNQGEDKPIDEPESSDGDNEKDTDSKSENKDQDQVDNENENEET